jgi:hypothetical protein
MATKYSGWIEVVLGSCSPDDVLTSLTHQFAFEEGLALTKVYWQECENEVIAYWQGSRPPCGEVLAVSEENSSATFVHLFHSGTDAGYQVCVLGEEEVSGKWTKKRRERAGDLLTRADILVESHLSVARSSVIA